MKSKSLKINLKLQKSKALEILKNNNRYKFIDCKRRRKMLIFVRQANGNGFQLQVNPNSSIDHLFSCIKEKISSTTETFSLFLKGQLISQTSKSFADLKIKDQDIIHMKWTTKKTDRQCLINVNIFHQHDIYSLRINSHQTVTKLKHKIAQITHIHPKSQCLVFRGKKLYENSTLVEEEIQNDSLISLIAMERKEPFQKYDEYFGFNERELLESITSLKIKRSQSQATKASKCSLFRSDSLGIKTNQEYSSPEIEVKYLRNGVGLAESIDSEMQLNRLFNICMKGGNSQDINIQATTHEDQVILAGSYQFGSLKKNTGLGFSQTLTIAENQQHQQNQQIHEDNLFSSNQRPQSLYRKLELDQSYQSIEFQQMDHMHANQIQSLPNYQLLNQLNDSADLIE